MKLALHKKSRAFDFCLFRNKWKSIKSLLVQLVFTIDVLVGCKNPEKKATYEPVFAAESSPIKTIIFGVPNVIYYEETRKLVDYLNQHFGKNIQIRCVASKSLDTYLEELNNHKFDFTILNGLAALEASQKGYSIVGKLDADSSYYGVVVVHKDSALSSPSDLKGKTISMLGRSALAGSKMPLLFLRKNGLDVDKDVHFLYTPSFESTILNVYLGKSIAGAAWVVTWRKFVEQRPEILKKVAIKWKTPPLPNQALIMSDRLNQETKSKLLKLLLGMRQNETGIAALKDLGVTGFELANNSTYKSTEIFAKEYKSMFP